MKTIIELLSQELLKEAETTRKMLAIIPEDKFGWQPHHKSMTVKRLAVHIAELPGWIAMVLNTNELDFEDNPYQQEDINTVKDLLAYFEKSLGNSQKALAEAKENQLEDIWTLRAGDTIYSKDTKYEVIRMALAQQIHHRAQLGVFLRLLDVNLPASYGPSADTGF